MPLSKRSRKTSNTDLPDQPESLGTPVEVTSKLPPPVELNEEDLQTLRLSVGKNEDARRVCGRRLFYRRTRTAIPLSNNGDESREHAYGIHSYPEPKMGHSDAEILQAA